MNELLKQKLNKLPAAPGVYFHKNASGEIIYVGKAAVLKNRVRQYFQNSKKDVKTAALVADNTAQTQYIVNRVAPYPIPAYTVANPTTPAA